MKIKSTINIVLRDLAEARELIDDLKNYPGVPLLQMELAKAKCRSAEEVIRLLSDLSEDHFTGRESEHDSIPETLGSTIVVLKEESRPEPVEIEQIVEIGIVSENTETPTGFDEDEHREKISRVVDAIVNIKEPVAPGKPKPEDRAKKIVADKFSHLSSSLNEQIGDQKKESQGNSQISRPLTDLTREIGLNDRFFFIREVFNGKKDDYQRVISDLNRVDNMDDAMRIIEDGTESDPSDEPVKMLLDLVKRKISSSRNE